MLNIIERLDREKFAPSVCVLAKGGKLDHVVEDMGIPLLELPFETKAKPYGNLHSRVRQLAAPFRPHKFSLWHSFHYSDDYTEPLIARAAGAKAWIYTKKNMNWHRRSWQLRTLLATRVAAQNSDMINEFFAGPIHRRKTRFVPRGVVLEQFRSATPSLRLRERLAIPTDYHIVGCVAQLLPVKGHPTLIAALARIPKTHLLLAGKSLDKNHAAELRKQVTELGLDDRVTFLDFVDDVPSFLAEIDLFVLPTWARWRQEGCPVALLEAMASGCACIATDIPGARDLVVHTESGWLVPPEQIELLAAALQHLLDRPEQRQRLGRAAQARIAAHYTIEHEVAAHEKLYAEALGW
ncbi:MAG: glycosyltransferase [Anaerolineales bacterium]|nr:glycosyltransferase [Anaerolineales bacterium]